MEGKVAVLVDGDNIGVRHAQTILHEAQDLGLAAIRRVYANAAKSGWENAPEYRLIHAGGGKNAADILLAIEAMELALVRGVRTFVIASSDGDFSHLAHKLRELGAVVVGVGEEKAPMGFRAACGKFRVIRGALVTLAENRSCKPTAMDINIRDLIASHSSNGSGMTIASLGPKMSTRHGTRISAFPEKTWRAYFLARPSLYDLDPRGPEAHVRFKPQGFAQAA